MAKLITCDICKRPTKKIVGKVLFIPVIEDSSYSASDYEALADVGECCQNTLSRMIRFRRRKRRAKAVDPVG